MTRRPRLSVAMTTYNGARHVDAQLASIVAQTRLPDELVIVDDGSTDGTVDIVRSFAAGAAADAGVAVTVDINDERIGAVRNVEQAIKRCTGDIVVLSDQDDVWLPERLEVVATVLGGGGPAGLFADAWIIDDKGSRTGRRLWQEFGFSGRRRRRWDTDPLGVLLQGSVVTGATLAVTADVLDLVLPLPSFGWHDHWIALLLAATTGLAAQDQPLVEYRVHGANATGVPRELAAERDRRLAEPQALVDACRQYEEAIVRLTAAGADDAAIARLQEKVEHLRSRTTLPSEPLRRLGRVGREALAGRYFRCSAGLRSMAFDVAYGGQASAGPDGSDSRPSTDWSTP